jgi:hypothetical protein
MPLPRAPRPPLYSGLIAAFFVLTLCANAADDGTRKSSTFRSLNSVGITSRGNRVDLMWNPSTSQEVIGYNIYRSKKSGGPYRKINPVLNPSTIYCDTSVADGKTYYYVTTAVTSDDQESAYSNQAQATIP